MFLLFSDLEALLGKGGGVIKVVLESFNFLILNAYSEACTINLGKIILPPPHQIYQTSHRDGLLFVMHVKEQFHEMH